MRSGIYGAVSSKRIDVLGLSTQSHNNLNFAFGITKSNTPIEQCQIFESEKDVFALYGVCMNSDKAFGEDNPPSNCLRQYIESPDKFDTIEGPVQGFYFDKQIGRLVVHTDFARQKPIFYYNSNELFVFASSLLDVVKLLKLNNVPVDVDIQAAAMLITFASVLGENTLVSGVKKLMPGHSLEVSKNGIKSISRSNLLDINRDINNMSDAIELIDTSFRASTNMMCAVNEKFGKGQLNLLSGGIDSRMVFLQTVRMTHDIKCLCFSAQDYLDHRISRSIALDFGADYNFQNLRKGEYMLETDSVFEYDGTINYLSSAHHRSALDYLNPSNAGLIASGQLGNEILTEFYMPNSSGDNVISSIMSMPKAYDFCRENLQFIWSQTPESTIFKLYNRGFLYTNSAAYSTQRHGVLYSPFTSQEFVKNALKLHPDLIKNHRVYLEWMKSCYPDAIKYDWERYRAKPINGFALNAAKLKMKLLSRFVYPLSGYKGASMSPVQHWYNESNTIQEFYNKTFHDKRCYLDIIPELSDLVDSNYKSMNVTNKASVLTLLLALEKYIHS